MENPAKQWFNSVSLVFVLLAITTVVPSYTESTQQDAPSNRNGEPYYFYQQSEYPRDCGEVMGQCPSTQSTNGVYDIKPDGYSEVFEVYCDSDGYTVIERFTNDFISFNRSWEDFASGFGFLRRDFWLGNQKLSYLTNQKRYKLQMDVVLNDGSTFYVTYDEFRISDEFGHYRLISTGLFNRTIVTCPPNMVSGDCTCQRTCAYPGTCNASVCHVTGSCVCPDGFFVEGGLCVPRNQCGCFVEGADDGLGTILQDGGVYTSPNCGRRCSCSSGNLNCEDIQCSPLGNCGQSDNGWNCSCNLGYEGDGVECIPIATDCQDTFDNGETSSGVYDIIPARSEESFQVYCNMSDGGGWTVIQRQDGSGDFYRDWADYKGGFGSLDGGMWLGNQKIFHLTNQKDYELRIDLKNRQGTRYYGLYRLFRINDESQNYRLASVGSYTGTAGLGHGGFGWNVGREFSTRDRDNDGWSAFDCAEEHRGGWWFGEAYNVGSSYSSYCRNHDHWCEHFTAGSGCAGCTWVHLNADYHSGTRGENIFWEYDPGQYYCSMQYTEMRIRPVQT